MTKIIKAPSQFKYTSAVSVFLGGSIDMGTAEDWQTKLSKDLSDYSDEDLILLNPRRDDWDSSWAQDPTPGTNFHEQVDWELNRQEESDLLVYYFSPDSKSPITLLELGRYANDDNTVVFCNKEFYRYGNVKMICDRYCIRMVETYDELLSALRGEINFLLEYYK